MAKNNVRKVGVHGVDAGDRGKWNMAPQLDIGQQTIRIEVDPEGLLGQLEICRRDPALRALQDVRSSPNVFVDSDFLI